MNIKDALFDSIEKLPSDVFNYHKVEFAGVSLMTDRAAMIKFRINSTDKFTITCLPLSQLKKDNNNNLWISRSMCQRKGLSKIQQI